MNESPTYLIVAPLFHPHLGGVETYAHHLSCKLATRGSRVIVMTSRYSEDLPEYELTEHGYEILRLPSHSLMGSRLPLVKKGRAWNRCMDWLASQSPERVLVNTRLYGISVEAAKWAREQGLPVVVVDHGSAYLTLGNSVADIFIHAHEHTITKALAWYKPTYAGVSPASCEWLKTFGIHTQNVVPSGIDAPAYRAQASERSFRDEFGISPEQTLVSFVGRLEPEKGADRLAEAAQLLGDDYQVVMAGEGRLKERIEAAEGSNIHLVGGLAAPDVSALYRESDVFCLPSRSEGFGMAYLEAAVWGVPIVAPRVGIVESLLGCADNSGVLLESCSPQDVAQGICASPKGRSSEFAQAASALYSWDTSADLLDELFSTLEQS